MMSQKDYRHTRDSAKDTGRRAKAMQKKRDERRLNQRERHQPINQQFA